MLSARLEYLITSLGMKKSEFADRIGFTQAYISMILSGKKHNPSPRFYDSVSREFHVNSGWLRDGSGEVFAFPDLDISASDASLLAKYRLLPPSEQKIIDEIVDAMLFKSMAKQADTI
ncbi:helix-turn-helix transcriptional regulator [Brucepastera parasyntrophica]|uniref:helix-turn-helix domain-containing protein n=1 Tax=Brucepastera parasyntrophica TaxID=2880008 RepID=UPI0021097586|nr:helix-turn-helix transcriptional regulator [Brucepastera parasyntrophica]ULQ61080.1 helix-turn-helix transcriptional regulator [Brucepastera parasyntrophica]